MSIRKRIRILADVANPFGVIDTISGTPARFFAGNDLRFEITFSNDGQLIPASDIGEVFLQVKNFGSAGQNPTPGDPSLMSKSTDTIDGDATLASFAAGTDQQAVLEFTNLESNISTGRKFLVLWVTSAASPTTILSTLVGVLQVDQDGAGIDQPPPELIESLVTVQYANANYLRLDATNVGGNAAALRTGLEVYSEAESLALQQQVTGRVTLENVSSAITRTVAFSSNARVFNTGFQADAGAAPYTAIVAVPIAGRTEGDLITIQVLFAASTNPTIEVRNNTGAGTLLQSLSGNGEVHWAQIDLVYTGANWFLVDAKRRNDNFLQTRISTLTGAENQAVRQALSPVGAASTSSADFAIDFAAEAAVQTRNQDGDTHGTLTFTATNMAAGRSQTITINELDGDDVDLVFPADWVWLTPKPAKLFQDTSGILQVRSDSTTEASVYAAWSAGI